MKNAKGIKENSNRNRIARISHSIIALAIVFTIFNIIGMLYYHIPYWFDRSANATESIWRPHAFVLQAKEGLGLNYVDTNGYVNEDKPLSEDGYVLVMGSSHTQGKEVVSGQRFTDILNEKLGGKDCLKVYNMAIDGHFYDMLVDGFGAALQEFPNSDAIVLEIGSTYYEIEDLTASVEQRDYDEFYLGPNLASQMTTQDKLKALVKENLPYVNLVKKQLTSVNIGDTNAFGIRKTNNKETIDAVDKIQYYQAVQGTVNLMKSEYSGKIIILYHPTMALNKDGSIDWEKEDTYETFRSAVEDSGIYFVDMTETFQTEYEEKSVVPYGFSNTAPGEGHMNRYGHEMVAEKLYEVLTSGE